MNRHPMLTYVIFSQLLAAPAFATDMFKMSVQEKRNTLSEMADIAYPSKSEVPTSFGGSKKDFSEPDEVKAQNHLCYADETQFAKFEQKMLRSWSTAWMNKDVKAITAWFAESFKGSSLNAGLTKKTSPLKEVQISMWKNSGEINKKTAQQDISTYLSQFSKIERIDIKPENYLSPKSDRDENFHMNNFITKINFSIKGIDTKGNRREDRGTIELRVESSQDNYTLTSMNISSGMTVTAKAPLFAENSQSLKDLIVYPRTEAIRRGGYALSLADYNNDGHTDMLVGSRGPLEIYTGDGAGNFKKDTSTGIEAFTYVKSAIWADFNNDGSKDLLIVRFVPEGPGYTRNALVVFENNGKGKFTRKGKILEDHFRDNAMPAATGDFNNDGLLDIYVGYPGQKDFTTFNAESADKVGVKTQGIYLNKGNLSFEPKNMNEGKLAYERFDEHQRIYPHSAMSVDFDQDGSIDIMVVDDRGNLSPIYRNNGKGGFQESASLFGIENRGIGMSFASSDYNNDGSTDFAVTNVRFNAEDRIHNSCSLNWDFTGERQKDLRFFKGSRLDQGKKFAETSEAIGLSNFGDGLAGVDFIDFNNDGFEDLYVVNGLWSGGERDEDLASEYVRAANARRLGIPTRSGLNFNPYDTMSEQRSDTKSFVMDILMNAKNKDGKSFALGTKQRNKFFINQKDGTYLELGYVLGVDSEADGYTIAKADLNHDGAIDLILRNADPGNKNVKFSPVQVFLGNAAHAGNRIEIKLVGNKSNRDAIGATVEMKMKDKSLTRQVIGNNGTVQSEKNLWFGMGTQKKADQVIVKWPSGNKTVVKNLSPGFHVIEEEKELTKKLVRN